MMPTVVSAVVAGVVGLLIAVGTSVTLVQLQSQTPDPVDKPLVVYGDR
jgi:hypothetical protein